MKKTIYLIIFLTTISCSSDFLELYPETTLNEGNFYNSEMEFILLANGCYIPMRDYEKDTHWVIAEIPSDNASYQHNPIDGGAWERRVIDQFLASSSNSLYSGFWNMSYQGIYRCNKLLFELKHREQNITWSKGYKERCYGEALFLRALYYFNLVRQFGGVPLVLEPITSQAAIDIKRVEEEKIFETILADLNNAVTYFAGAIDTEENGRANWGAALSLLGKVYLTLHDYDKAETALKQVIGSKRYYLLPDFKDLFDPSKKDCKETIFAIQYSENSVELANSFAFSFAPWTSGGEITGRPNINISGSGSGWNQPTLDLINTFEEGDKRKSVSIGFWIGKDHDGVIRTIPYCAKYKPPISAPDNRCGDNLPILRYSDVLLMYAEVLNEKERTGEAIPFVEEVRFRAGLTEPLTGVDKSSLSELIARERQVEFCFENQRWYDLKRTGKALDILTEHGVREKGMKSFLDPKAFEMEKYKLLAPIPINEVIVNKIEQNIGY